MGVGIVGNSRGLILAGLLGVVTLLMAFGIGYYLAALNLAASNYSDEQRHQSYRYAADKPAEVDPSLPAPVLAQSKEYRTPCDNPKGRDESDLCAQWRAAKAAEDSALWTKWGFWVGLFGMIGLFWTLYYTRRAVEDTGKATKAMEAQNDLAKDTARRQLRAYLGVTMCQIENVLPGKIARFKLQVTNHGQTPAKEAGIASCSGLIAAEDFEMWRARFNHRPKPFGPITPGDFREYWVEIKDWVDADADMLISGKWIAVFAAVIVYRDAFGQRHFVACKAKLDPTGLAEGKAGLATLGRGNFAS